MTALRFALVKTSGIGALAVIGGNLETARGFVVFAAIGRQAGKTQATAHHAL